jgi:hypothetical protein
MWPADHIIYFLETVSSQLPELLKVHVQGFAQKKVIIAPFFTKFLLDDLN